MDGQDRFAIGLDPCHLYVGGHTNEASINNVHGLGRADLCNIYMYNILVVEMYRKERVFYGEHVYQEFRIYLVDL